MPPARARRGRAALVILGCGLAIAIAAGAALSYVRHDFGAHAASADQASHRAARPAGTLPPEPVAPARPQRADPLAGRATSFLATRAGTVLAAVDDLATRQTWTAGQGPPQAAASVVKLDILATLLAQHGQDGRWLSGPEESLASRMIEQSDNGAATALWNEVGGARGVRSFNVAAGLTRTSPSRCLVCGSFPWPGWGLTTTTPDDQIALLRQIAEPGRLLSDRDRGYALRLMTQVAPGQRWGVSGGVSPRAAIALKDGWLPLNNARTDWQINSVGWISGAGRDYLIAVLSTGNPTEQYGMDTIGTLSAVVWQSMGASR